MSQPLRLGILGTGNIAQQFSAGVAQARRTEIVAVGSRSAASAEDFCRNHRVPQAYGSYEQLLADPQVQAVYNSLPNSMHHEWTLRALAAGKHVLCEKPFAANLRQSQEMFDAARKRGLLLMEAFMYRSHPLTHAVLEQVRSGAIGQVRLVRTSFCFRTNRIEGNIRFDPGLAGGALMDVGCYCINFARMIAAEEPTTMHASGTLYQGVDDLVGGVLQFPGGVVASFTCGLRVHADNAAHICGTEGYIQVPIPWKPPSPGAVFTVARSIPPRMDGGKALPTQSPQQTHVVDAESPLYALEADDFAAAVLDGAPLPVSEQDTLGNMRVLDELRRQVGVAVMP